MAKQQSGKHVSLHEELATILPQNEPLHLLTQSWAGTGSPVGAYPAELPVKSAHQKCPLQMPQKRRARKAGMLLISYTQLSWGPLSSGWSVSQGPSVETDPSIHTNPPQKLSQELLGHISWLNVTSTTVEGVESSSGFLGLCPFHMPTF